MLSTFIPPYGCERAEGCAEKKKKDISFQKTLSKTNDD